MPLLGRWVKNAGIKVGDGCTLDVKVSGSVISIVLPRSGICMATEIQRLQLVAEMADRKVKKTAVSHRSSDACSRIGRNRLTHLSKTH